MYMYSHIHIHIHIYVYKCIHQHPQVQILIKSMTSYEVLRRHTTLSDAVQQGEVAQKSSKVRVIVFLYCKCSSSRTL